MNNCKDCNSTGIAIVTLDNTKDVAIQCCDTCKQLTDEQAIKLVKKVIYESFKINS